MHVVLVCVFGMSTYYVVKAVENAARARGEDVTLEAVPVSDLVAKVSGFDLVLLGPQVRFKHDQVAKIAAAAGKKMLVIPPELYGMTEAEKLLDLILHNKPDSKAKGRNADET